MKKLGLCGMMMAGILLLTGCNMGLCEDCEDKVDEIITVLEDKEVTLTEEQLNELLEKIENKEVTLTEEQLNKVLEKIQDKKISIDEAYNLYTLSIAAIDMNYKGVRDNFIFSVSGPEGSAKEYFYKNDEGNYTYAYIEDDKTSVVYEVGTEVFRYSVSDKSPASKEKLSFSSTEAYIQKYMRSFSEDLNALTKEYLLKAEYSDNGNIILTFADSDEYSYRVAVVEITEDAKIVGYEIEAFGSSDENNWGHDVITATYEYGAANDADFESLVAVAKNTPLSE